MRRHAVRHEVRPARRTPTIGGGGALLVLRLLLRGGGGKLLEPCERQAHARRLFLADDIEDGQRVRLVKVIVEEVVEPARRERDRGGRARRLAGTPGGR